MKHYRLTFDVDFPARDLEHAQRRSIVICNDVEQRHWVQSTRPESLYEPISTQQQKETP